MPLAYVGVDQQRLGGGLADRNDPAAAALAAADGDQPGDEVEVVELKVDHLAGADRGLEYEPDDGLVATVMECVPRWCVRFGHGAGPNQSAQLVVGKRLH
jgi:hypothetical protein